MYISFANVFICVVGVVCALLSYIANCGGGCLFMMNMVNEERMVELGCRERGWLGSRASV